AARSSGSSCPRRNARAAGTRSLLEHLLRRPVLTLAVGVGVDLAGHHDGPSAAIVVLGGPDLREAPAVEVAAELHAARGRRPARRLRDGVAKALSSHRAQPVAGPHGG